MLLSVLIVFKVAKWFYRVTNWVVLIYWYGVGEVGSYKLEVEKGMTNVVLSLMYLFYYNFYA